MNSSSQPLLASGLAIPQTLAHIRIGTAIVSGLLSATALVLALLRRPAAAVRIIGGIACAIASVPPALAVWVVSSPGSGPSHALFQFAFLILSFLPVLVATAALLISPRPAPRSEAPTAASP